MNVSNLIMVLLFTVPMFNCASDEYDLRKASNPNESVEGESSLYYYFDHDNKMVIPNIAENDSGTYLTSSEDISCDDGAPSGDRGGSFALGTGKGIKKICEYFNPPKPKKVKPDFPTGKPGVPDAPKPPKGKPNPNADPKKCAVPTGTLFKSKQKLCKDKSQIEGSCKDQKIGEAKACVMAIKKMACAGARARYDAQCFILDPSRIKHGNVIAGMYEGAHNCQKKCRGQKITSILDMEDIQVMALKESEQRSFGCKNSCKVPRDTDIFQVYSGKLASPQCLTGEVLITRSNIPTTKECGCDLELSGDSLCAPESNFPTDKLKKINQGSLRETKSQNSTQLGINAVPEAQDEIFGEVCAPPTGKCDLVAKICGLEGGNAVLPLGVDILTGVGAASLAECALQLGVSLPFDGVQIVGMESAKDLADFAGDKFCDLLSCLPPADPITISATVICGIYQCAKGALNCYIANKECEMEELEKPIEDPQHGPCYRSSVMACVMTANGTEAVLPQFILSQCENLARRYRYREGSDAFNICRDNCYNNTLNTQIENNFCFEMPTEEQQSDGSLKKIELEIAPEPTTEGALEKGL